ncbi:glycoside hydrolase family 78 protein [Paenibacillus swuensis]|nr:CARDB domain-containing protein [Paenibacillus swuensis]
MNNYFPDQLLVSGKAYAKSVIKDLKMNGHPKKIGTINYLDIVDSHTDPDGVTVHIVTRSGVSYSHGFHSSYGNGPNGPKFRVEYPLIFEYEWTGYIEESKEVDVAGSSSISLGQTSNASANIKVKNFDSNVWSGPVNVTQATETTWDSTNKGVATISDSGKITTISQGTTTIKATWIKDGYTLVDSYTLTVIAPPNQPDLTPTSVTPDKPSIPIGSTITFTVEVQNIGTQAIPSSTPVAVKVFDQTGRLVKNTTISGGFTGGQKKTFTFQDSFPTSGATRTYQTIVDPAGSITEASETNNERQDTFSAAAGGGGITGDFDILPGPNIKYRDSFTLHPKDITNSGSCSYSRHTFKITRDGTTYTSPFVYSKTQDSSYTESNYPYVMGVGSHQISLTIHSNCGEIIIGPKTLEITGPQNNNPPQGQIGFVRSSDRTKPLTTVLEGTRLDLILIQDPRVPTPHDPDGDDIYLVGFDFSESDAWTKEIDMKYANNYTDIGYLNVLMDKVGTHRVKATIRDEFGATAILSTVIEVVPENPIPVITGPTEVVEGRPVSPPFDANASFSHMGRQIDHSRDQWTNLRTMYPDIGTEILSLDVFDEIGLQSLAPDTHTLTVKPDIPPTPKLEYTDKAVRNSNVLFRNTSYSPDGDNIVTNSVTYKYDANHNGTFADDGQQPITMTPQKTFTFNPTRVGKYQFCVYVREDWGKDARGCYDFEVVNDSPFVSFTVSSTTTEPFAINNKPVTVIDFMSGAWTSNDYLHANKSKAWMRNPHTGVLAAVPFQKPTIDAPTNPTITLMDQPFSTGDRENGRTYYLEDGYYLSWKQYDYGGSTAAYVYIKKYKPSYPDPARTGNLHNVMFDGPHRIDYENKIIYVREQGWGYESYYVDRVKGYNIHDFITLTNPPVVTMVNYSDFIKTPVDLGYEDRWIGTDGTVNSYSWDRPLNGGPWSTYQDNNTSSYGMSLLPNGDYIYGADAQWRLNVYDGATRALKRTLNHRFYWYGEPYMSADEKAIGVVNSNHSSFSLYQYQSEQELLASNGWTSYTGRYENIFIYSYYNGTINAMSAVDSNGTIRWTTPGHANTHSSIITNDGFLIYTLESRLMKVNILTGATSIIAELSGYRPNVSEGYSHYYSFPTFLPDGTILVNINSHNFSTDSDYVNTVIIDSTKETTSNRFTLNQLIPTTPANYALGDSYQISYTLRMNKFQHDLAAGMSFGILNHQNMLRVESNPNHTRLVRITNGQKTILREIPYPLAKSTYHTFKIMRMGDQIKVYINGVPLITTQESSYKNGTFGPFTEIGKAEFKAVTYADLSQLNGSSKVNNYGIVGEELEYSAFMMDTENDPAIPALNEWKYEQLSQKFLDAGDGKSGASSLHNRTFNTSNPILDKVGLYRISYSTKDDPHPEHRYGDMMFNSYRQKSNVYANNVIIHRKPISLFTLSLNPNYSVRWHDSSYDPDRWLSPGHYSTEPTGIPYGSNRGILQAKYYYVSPSGATFYEKLTSPQETGTYEVGMAVQDEYGAWSDWNVEYLNATVTGPGNMFPPAAALTNPNGTQSAPTLYSTLRPNITWAQSDPDAGNVFTGYQILISNEQNTQMLLDTGESGQWTSNTWANWAVNRDLPANEKLRVRVRVRDNQDHWSAYSTTQWMLINREPNAVMIVPSGTQGSPTPMISTRPTLKWNQTDPDAGTVFQGFHIQILNEANHVLRDTGPLWQQSGAGTQWWNLDQDLPRGQKLQVRVRVQDNLHTWSPWSQTTWMIINRAPVADFEWSPTPTYEGDVINLANLSTDPDGDAMTYQWQITGPGGLTKSFATQNGALSYAETIDRIGPYHVTLTATDLYGMTSEPVSKTIIVLPLTIIGEVFHTELWDQKRIEYNLKETGSSDAPRGRDVFWAGEKFRLRSQLTDTGGSSTKPTRVHVRFESTGHSVELTSTPSGNWTGELWQQSMDGLADGTYSFRFTSYWSNSAVKITTVLVELRDRSGRS